MKRPEASEESFLASRAQRLLEEALDVEGARRDAFIAERCGGDARLEATVRALLSCDEEAGSFLEAPIVRPALSPLGPEATYRDTDRRVGPYLLLGKIGEGGMGSVFLARSEAIDEAGGEVALKILRADLRINPERFAREQEILRQLEHPYIAGFIDHGVTEAGWPFLVVEYVDGLPVTDHCIQYELSARERLSLFGRICKAVSHAHQHLVVHRDLKPSNVLVTAEGVPKLLDFGIAKLLPADPEASQQVTGTASLVLTPSYAAPEHVARGRVTTATDVYSLGVLLYELLTGRPPFDWTGASPREMLERWRWLEPEPPSQVQTDLELGADLDRIVLKALRYEPERRYQAVSDLAADLQRYLEGKPVSAGPATAWYRLTKLVGRNRWWFAGLAMALAVLFGFLGLTLAHNLRLQQERDVALAAEERADRVSEFLVDTFLLFSPFDSEELTADRTLTPRELLQVARERADERLADSPRARADLLEAIGLSYRGLGMYGEGIEVFRRAAAIRAESEPEGLEVASALFWLAQMELSAGDRDAAEEALEQSLEIREQKLTAQDIDLRDVWRLAARLETRQGRFESAEAHARKAVESERLYGEPMEVAEGLAGLGEALLRQGRYAEAESALAEALEVEREAPTPEGESVNRKLMLSARLSDLATVRRRMGRYAEAEELIREGLALDRSVLGEHPLTASSLNNLGLILLSLGRYSEAESLIEEGLNMRTELLGPDHSQVAESTFNLARARFRQGDLEAAETGYRRALELWEVSLGPADHNLASGWSGLAEVAAARGELGPAEELYRRALERRGGGLGREHPRYAESLENLGAFLVSVGRASEGLPLLEEALKISEARLPPGHPSIQRVSERLVAVRRDP